MTASESFTTLRVAVLSIKWEESWQLLCSAHCAPVRARQKTVGADGKAYDDT